MYEGLTYQQLKGFLHDVGKYFWDEPYLYKVCANNIISLCDAELEKLHILKSYHASLVVRHQYVMYVVRSCDVSQQRRDIFLRHESPMTPILDVELFDMWGSTSWDYL